MIKNIAMEKHPGEILIQEVSWQNFGISLFWGTAKLL